MIEADRAELEVHLKQRAVEIREKEVQLFNDNFGVLATQATFLTGLGFGGLTMDTRFVEIPNHNVEQIHVTLFYTISTLSVGFNILTMILASYCMIFGPALAIRGPDGSMTRAVNGMYEERRWVLRFFWTGLGCIMVSGIFLGWMKFGRQVAIAMTLIFFTFCVGIVFYITQRAVHKFAFPKGAAGITHFLLDGYDPEQNRMVKTRGGAGKAAATTAWGRRAGNEPPRNPAAEAAGPAALRPVPGAQTAAALDGVSGGGGGAASSMSSFRRRFVRGNGGGTGASPPATPAAAADEGGAGAGGGAPTTAAQHAASSGLNGGGSDAENVVRDADRAGFLNKRVTKPTVSAMVTRSWKRRLFVLRGATLTYFTDVSDATGANQQHPKGEFTLGPGCVITVSAEEASKQPHMFSVRWRSGLLLELSARSADDQGGWARKLRVACGKSPDDEEDEELLTQQSDLSVASELGAELGTASFKPQGADASSKSGLLTKNGKLRFFSLQGSVLQYYTLDGSLKREITLGGVAVDVERHASKPLVLILTVGKKAIELAAQSAEDLEQWLVVFENVARGADSSDEEGGAVA
jgi:hypothetical protein